MKSLREEIEKDVAVSDSLWDALRSRSKEVHFKKGEVIIPFGSNSQFSYFIASGTCICSQAAKSGEARVVWFYLDELFTFFSATDSYFNNEPTKYELRALEDCSLVRFHKDTIDELIATDRAFNEFFIKRIVATYIAIFEIRSYLLTYTSEEFLAYIYEKYPQLIERVPAKYIADFIGVTPEWYSKLKKQLGL